MKKISERSERSENKKIETFQDTAWNVIDTYFKDNHYNLVAHHLDSYNDFFLKGIYQIFRDNNPIRMSAIDENKQIKYECHVYLGGKNGDNIYFGKPVIYDDEMSNSGTNKKFTHYMYPNDARLRNMTYGVSIHYDIEVEFMDNENESNNITQTFDKIYLGRFPIMLHSNLCILKGLSPEACFNVGECRNDYGGYFIINGKEKVIVSQEKFADNMLYVRKYKEDNLYSFSCEVHSVSEDSSKPIRYTSVKVVAPDASYTNNQIVIDIPNVKKPMPLFIVMRALGVISDKSIIEYCLLDLDANVNMLDLFTPSIHDANTIYTQQVALEFIAKFTKRQTVTGVLEILMNYFLPHIGEDNFLNKAYFIGFMVHKLLRVFTGKEAPTDRDNFKFKRVETSGSLIYDLFREYFLIQKREVLLNIDKSYYFGAQYKESFDKFTKLLDDNLTDIFLERTVEKGFKKAFKGNWGENTNTKRVGVIQDLNRLSWFTHMSHLRKINLPLDSTAKVVSPHLLHSTQWGIIDPVDTPDGANVGLHKHMAISTAITSGVSSYPIIHWFRDNTPLQMLNECSSYTLGQKTKVMVNGNWIGVIDHPIFYVERMKLFRRNGIIPIYTSISFSIESNIIYIYTDGGRLTRPIFYRSTDADADVDADADADSNIDLNMDLKNNGVTYGRISFENPHIIDKIQSKEYTWVEAISGFAKKTKEFHVRDNTLYSDVSKIYPGVATIDQLMKMLEHNRAIVDYIDTAEEETALIAMKPTDISKDKFYTHVEIDPSLIFGVMGNSIIYPENNQLPRNCFSCGQSRQAVSVYHSNAQMRMDKMGVLLHYGQTPIIKSRYLDYINHEQQPYGVNAIVAIMSYTGYNVEDAILINEGSVKRGIFRTTYYTTYEAKEESSKVSGTTVNSIFANVDTMPNVKGFKEGYDYSKLDKYGLVKENTPITDRTVLIGQVTSSEQGGEFSDHSKVTKKGQLGFVDKAFMSEGEEGFRIAKIRICEQRVPAVGDKMASRAGQKGTIGLIIPEADMPFTANGTRPDLIINPHALPSRMTVGQLIECLFGKACVAYGAYGDCTAFAAKGSNYTTYGPMLTKEGYHHSGNELLYNGYTGQQISADIFIGPTYYMRLKHMVKDKINYRATGKRDVLTRQVNQGRANDGGLRIGEMERDGIMGHGMSAFLKESYLVRGDQYYMAVCNTTGCVAVYNSYTNIFLSPLADGPLKYSTSLENNQLVLDSVSKFGRSFSILRIPYALKLLIQELQTMNVQMRIITEDNINQLTSLSYQSGNLQKLLGASDNDTNVQEIIQDYKQYLTKKLQDSNNQYRKGNSKKMGVDHIWRIEDYSDNEEEQVTLEPSSPSSQLQVESMPFGDLESGYVEGPSPEYATAEGYGGPFLPSVPSSPSGPSVPSGTVANIPIGGAAAAAALEEGNINLFPDNPTMNKLFNKLSGADQSKILQMDVDQRLQVMGELVKRLLYQQQSQVGIPIATGTNEVLKPYFMKLPLDKQLTALQQGYKSMSNDFDKLTKKVSSATVNIITPTPMQEVIEKQFPLLKVKTGGNDSSDSSDNSNISSDSSSTSSSSSSSSSESTSGGGSSSSQEAGTKRVTFS